jgi:MFS family permease
MKRSEANCKGDCTAEEKRRAAQMLEPIVSEICDIPSKSPQPQASPGIRALLPSMAVVFAAYLLVGIALPVLPLHVHQGLGLSTFVVGLVTGSQFGAALLTRLWAGHFIDTRGARKGVLIGLIIASVSGLLYLLSLRFISDPETSVKILLLGRAILGAAESFIITGALTLGLSLMGPKNSGKVMSWIGTALYAALALGAPVGTVLFNTYGFQAVALSTLFIPLATLPLVLSFRSVESPSQHERAVFRNVVGAVWMPGLGLALSGVGFAAITTFVVLYFAQRGWEPAWLAFTALSVAFVAGRLMFGHLPDRIGGAKVALVSILIESVALGLIWVDHSYLLALSGVTLAGLGYSLVYPSFGVEAVRHTPPQSRGLAMGAYTVFLDLSLGVSSPVLGLIADRAGLGTVFLASMLIVLCAATIALRFLWLQSGFRLARRTQPGAIHSAVNLEPSNTPVTRRANQ